MTNCSRNIPDLNLRGAADVFQLMANVHRMLNRIQQSGNHVKVVLHFSVRDITLK